MREGQSKGDGERGGWREGEKELGSSAEVLPSPSDSQSLENLTPARASQSLGNLHPRAPAPLLPELSTSSPNPARDKHVPERTCAACRTKMAQSDLYRIRKTPSGWTMDRGVTVGRSAYLCSSPYCHVEKRLKRTFGAQANQISTQISEMLKALEGQKENSSGANIG